MMQSPENNPSSPQPIRDLFEMAAISLPLAAPGRALMADNVVILLGPPGSGKGTQADLLANSLSLPHISTGDLLRQAIKSGNELGQQIKAYVDQGKLAPDALVVEVVRERLSRPSCANGCILDGFPRTLAQAQALDQMLSDMGVSTPRVVELVVPEKVLLERIIARGKSGSGRSDDNLEVAKTRFEEYRRDTAPVSGYYANKGVLTKINGEGLIPEIHHLLLGGLAQAG